MKKLLLPAFLFLHIVQSGFAQGTTLSAGDLFFIAFNSAPTAAEGDEYVFVNRVPLTNGTVIGFTDRGYFGSNTWQAAVSITEGSVSWTVGSTIPEGSVIKIKGLSAYTVNPVNSVETGNGTVTLTEGNMPNGLSLSFVGDQVIVFQSATGSPSATGAVMIAGINFFSCSSQYSQEQWNDGTCAMGPNSSRIPPGLVGGVSAFHTGPVSGQDPVAGRFNCPASPYSTLALMASAAMSPANWTLATSALPVTQNCTYVGVATSITGHPLNRVVCPASNTTFSVTATGASGYQWQENTGSGFVNISNGGVYGGVATSTLSLSGITAPMNGYHYRCVVSGSATINSNPASLTVSNPVAEATKNDATCFDGNNGTASLDVSGGTTPYQYSWPHSGSTSASVSGLTPGTYQYTVTDMVGCSINGEVEIGSPPAVNVAVLLETPANCYGGTDGQALVNASGGTPGYTYEWSEGYGILPLASNLSAGTYICTVTDANGCTAEASVSISQPDPVLPSGFISVSGTQNGSTLYRNCNELVATVNAAGIQPVAGNVEAKVWIEAEQPTQFVKRHYEILPADNPESATANVTLYFLQAEFDAFNLLNPSHPLPSHSDDEAGKANLLIEKRAGSGGSSGLPSDYGGDMETIDPNDEDIVWNADYLHWEVTFAVTGFSGFFVKTTEAPLPVKLVSFKAGSTENTVELSWQTAEERYFEGFEIQRSSNGKSFSQLGFVKALGRGNTYRFSDTGAFSGVTYYRLKLVDLDGVFVYSGIVSTESASATQQATLLRVFPNPASGNTITIETSQGGTAVLYDLTGRPLHDFQLEPGQNSISTPRLTDGIYYLRMANGKTAKLILSN